MVTLSREQQAALFLSVRELRLLVHGLRASGGVDPRTGAVTMMAVGEEVAAWAIPYVQRVKEAEALFGEGKGTEAMAAFRALLDEVPGAAVVQMNIGVCHAERGEKPRAVAWLSQALEAAPPEHQAVIRENLRQLENRPV